MRTPRATASRTKLAPMKPAPPVTSQVGTGAACMRFRMGVGSERDVVVREVVDRRGLARWSRLLPRCRFLALRAWAALVRAATATATATTAFTAAAQHLHLVGDDVGVVALLAVVAGVLAVADPALDVDL